MNDQIARYMSLRYPIELTPDPDGGYIAEHPDLPGCVAQGETADGAVAALERARRLWIKVRLEDRLPVPEPTEADDFDRLDLQPEFIGTCGWCSRPVYDDQEYVDGDDGEGIMHKNCNEVEDE